MSNLITPPNFTLQEYLNQGSRSVIPQNDRPLIEADFRQLSIAEQQKCLSILFALQVTREKFAQPIFITCGYRSKRHELSRGRTGNSMHTEFAVDVNANDMPALHQAFGNWNGGYKWYEDNSFIHIDLGRYRRW